MKNSSPDRAITSLVNKKISIIIPAFNEEKHLPSCLESIKKNDFPADSFEVVVVDNGSTDRTVDIAIQYGAKLFRNDRLNVSGLRNLGAREATGEILAFLDADCTVAKDWLGEAARYSNDKTVAAWGAPPEIPELPTWVQRTWYMVRKPQHEIQMVDWLESMNLFVRREHFLSIGGFAESLITCEDVDFCYRIKRFGQIISDSRIRVIHHGEARTLKEFFRKEMWRGMGNFRGLFTHGLSLKEAPSLLLPLYFAGVIPLVFLVAFIMNAPLLLLLFLLWFLPAGLVFLKKRPAGLNFGSGLKLIFLLQVYFLARTAAIFKFSSTR